MVLVNPMAKHKSETENEFATSNLLLVDGAGLPNLVSILTDRAIA
jgi:hypothetical protein